MTFINKIDFLPFMFDIFFLEIIILTAFKILFFWDLLYFNTKMGEVR